MKNIKDIAIAAEKRNVRVPISEEDLESLRTEFVNKSVLFKQIADEKAAALKSFKDRMSPVEKNLSTLISQINDEYIEVNTTIYLLDDQEAGLMRGYLEDGTEVFSRPLRPDEKQLNLLSINQK